jgi:hypothetical protein
LAFILQSTIYNCSQTNYIPKKIVLSQTGGNVYVDIIKKQNIKLLLTWIKSVRDLGGTVEAS